MGFTRWVFQAVRGVFQARTGNFGTAGLTDGIHGMGAPSGRIPRRGGRCLPDADTLPGELVGTEYLVGRFHQQVAVFREFFLDLLTLIGTLSGDGSP